MESDIFNIVSQFGFPIALSIYLLITRDKTIQQNTAAMQELKTVISNETLTLRKIIKYKMV